MSEKAIRRQNVGGYLMIAVVLLLWPVVEKVIALGVHPMVAIFSMIALATIVWYLLFVRRG